MGTPPNTSNSSVSPRTVSRLNAFGKSCKVTITCQGLANSFVKGSTYLALPKPDLHFLFWALQRLHEQLLRKEATKLLLQICQNKILQKSPELSDCHLFLHYLQHVLPGFPNLQPFFFAKGTPVQFDWRHGGNCSGSTLRGRHRRRHRRHRHSRLLSAAGGFGGFCNGRVSWNQRVSGWNGAGVFNTSVKRRLV